MTIRDLTSSERFMLNHLADEEYGQYGEYHGSTFDALLHMGLVQFHDPGEHQTGFIAQDRTGSRGDMYRAVSVTEAGRDTLKAINAK